MVAGIQYRNYPATHLSIRSSGVLLGSRTSGCAPYPCATLQYLSMFWNMRHLQAVRRDTTQYGTPNEQPKAIVGMMVTHPHSR